MAMDVNDITTIRVRWKTKKRLDRVKVHPRETYEDVILRLVKKEEKERTERIRV